VSNVWTKVSDSPSSSEPQELSSAVTVCGASLLFVQVTVSPWKIVTSFGWKAKSTIPTDGALAGVGDDVGVPVGVPVGVALGVDVPGAVPAAIVGALSGDDRVLIERYVAGRELAISILDDQALPIVEAIPEQADLFNYEARYEIGRTRYVCPAVLDDAETDAVTAVALRTWEALGCAGFARVDVMLGGEGVGPQVLEVNSVPGLTDTSLLPIAAEAAGISFERIVERAIELAIAQYGAESQYVYAYRTKLLNLQLDFKRFDAAEKTIARLDESYHTQPGDHTRVQMELDGIYKARLWSDRHNPHKAELFTRKALATWAEIHGDRTTQADLEMMLGDELLDLARIYEGARELDKAMELATSLGYSAKQLAQLEINRQFARAGMKKPLDIEKLKAARALLADDPIYAPPVKEADELLKRRH